MAEVILQVEGLQKFFPIKRGLIPRTTGYIKAVNDFSLDIRVGETVGLVGESGCGKTTAGRSILRLIEPTAGTILFKGQNILPLKGLELRKVRRHMQIIFQDPYGSLNPRMTVGKIVGDGLTLHKLANGSDKKKQTAELLDRVGLSRKYINRYPHEFSGGQRQRIGIARALALNPDFIVCDEAVSALDVSIQAQIINLLQDLQKEFTLSYLFISHDLAVVKHICHRINVMYLGEIVESASTKEMFAKPLHPYTRALLSAIPSPDPTLKTERIILQGDVPAPRNLPSGCYFHPRCPEATPECRVTKPKIQDYGNGHRAACLKIKEPIVV